MSYFLDELVWNMVYFEVYKIYLVLKRMSIQQIPNEIAISQYGFSIRENSHKMAILTINWVFYV